MAILILIALAQLVLLFVIWGSLLELIRDRRSADELASQAIQQMELQTMRSMFQAARFPSGEVIDVQDGRS